MVMYRARESMHLLTATWLECQFEGRERMKENSLGKSDSQVHIFAGPKQDPR